MLFIMLLDSKVSLILEDYLGCFDAFVTPPRELVFRFKCLSVASRRTGYYKGKSISRKLTSVELMNLVGIDLATGRCDGKPDLEQEQDERTADGCSIRWAFNPKGRNVSCDDDYAHQLTKHMIDKAIFKVMKPSDGNMDLEDVWLTSKVGTSGGSSSMARKLLSNAGHKNVGSAKKTHLVEMLEEDPVQGWLLETPITIGVVSCKPEMWKTRLIVGVDEKTYMI